VSPATARMQFAANTHAPCGLCLTAGSQSETLPRTCLCSLVGACARHWGDDAGSVPRIVEVSDTSTVVLQPASSPGCNRSKAHRQQGAWKDKTPYSTATHAPRQTNAAADKLTPPPAQAAPAGTPPARAGKRKQNSPYMAWRVWGCAGEGLDLLCAVPGCDLPRALLSAAVAALCKVKK
jgi:hypothetical protein